MADPAYLSALVTLVKAATIGSVENRVYAEHAPRGTAFPYVVIRDPSGDVLHHSNKTAEYSRLIQCSVYAASSATATQIEHEIGSGITRSGVEALLTSPWRCAVCLWTGTTSLIEQPHDPNAAKVFHRALQFRLILGTGDSIR